jgi:hypothetical protein
MGDHDDFESKYMAKLSVLLAGGGVQVSYAKDRAGIDTGLHLFAHAPGGMVATHTRVWFQIKGKHATTLPLTDFEASGTVPTSVPVEYVEHWIAAPEPVYLAIYVESADVFIAEDVRDIVDRQWPGNSFYATRNGLGKHVTLRVDRTRVLDAARLEQMLAHRSMRIDGPSFRGRPLGHRLDPLRSQIGVCEPGLFNRLLNRILGAHDFRVATTHTVGSLTFMAGRLYQTLEWQSPAFAEYGFGPDDDFRSEPALEVVHDHVLVVCDSAPERRGFTTAERDALEQAITNSPPEAHVLVVFNGADLSGTGGTWRRTLRDDVGTFARAAGASMIGLEAMTFLVLVATLVYLEVVPELTWRHVNYLWSPEDIASWPTRACAPGDSL